MLFLISLRITKKIKLSIKKNYWCLYEEGIGRENAKPIKPKAFLNKSIFNGRGVNYLTIKQGIVFHIFVRNYVL
jgi:hypothetical protein